MHVLRYPRLHFKLSTIVYYQKHRTKMSTYKKNMSVAIKVEDTALIWMLISAKKQNVPVNAKCYRKEIMSPRCLLFIYLGLHTNYISAFTC